MPVAGQVLCPLCDRPREILTVQEAATLAGVHPRTIRRWVNDGRLEHRQIPSGGVRVLRSSLLQMPGITPSWMRWREKVAGERVSRGAAQGQHAGRRSPARSRPRGAGRRG